MTMKEDTLTVLQVLKRAVTFKRVLLLVVFGVLFGLLPLIFWPAALQSAAIRGLYFGITGCLSLMLTLWLVPLKKDGS